MLSGEPQLGAMGVDLEPTKVTVADGTRTNGYGIAALQQAAEATRNARF